MRSPTLTMGLLLALTISLTATAVESRAAADGSGVAPPSTGEGTDATDSAVATDSQAAEASPGEASTSEPVALASTPQHEIALGPVGYDAEGRPGRVHRVVRGDTLWDVSDAYLGTPWVWPSIWSENRDIENPHLIYPGDLLWITPTEIRRVSAEEAEKLLAGSPAALDDSDAIEVAEDAPAMAPPRPTLRFSALESVGLVSEDTLEGAASLVDNLEERRWLGSEDRVFIGMGEGEVEPGEQFTVFRAKQKVYDPDTQKPLGYYVHVLGWIEVTKVYPDVALAEVRMAYTEMRSGDPVLPRERVATEIELQPAETDVEGRIVYLPNDRGNSGSDEVVYLDRGVEHGLSAGNALEVFRPVPPTRDSVRGKAVDLPDRIVASLVVISAQPKTSVAVIRHARTEVRMGDRWRTSGEQSSP